MKKFINRDLLKDLKMSLLNFNFVMIYIIHKMLVLIKNNLNYLKVGLLPSKKNIFICFNDSLAKIIKNAFYFILEALFVLKIFKPLS